MRILAVEDDELLAQTVANVLSQQHYTVDIALDGEIGWEWAIATPYDLILLDVMLPKLDGISLCRQLRQEGYQMPILLLTAKDSRTDKVMGLDAGADDYVIKPVDFDELAARIRAILRRGHPTASPLLTWAALSFDPSSLEVSYAGQPFHLTATEHRLLELFLRNPQRVFSRRAIVEHLWTFDDQPEASTIKTYIKNLRQKLKVAGASPDLIETVYGLGYRLKPEPDHADGSDQVSPETGTTPVEQSLKEQQILFAVSKARNQFATQICDRLSVLHQTVESMEAGSLRRELYEQAIHEAHRFAGALGTFGFTRASHLAQAIEDLLHSQPVNSSQIQQLRHLIKALSQDLELSLNGQRFMIIDLNPDCTDLIQQTAQMTYESAQAISKIWLPTLEDAVEEVQESFRPEGISRVLLDGDRVAAWIAAFPQFNGRVVEIHPLMVAKGYQGKGLGRQMVSHVETWAQEQGALTLWVGTSDETHATSLSNVDLYGNVGGAIANFHLLSTHPCGFWLRLGFQIVGVLPDAEGLGKPNLMLAKPLNINSI